MTGQIGPISLAIIGSRTLSRENEVRVRLYLEQEFELDLGAISVIVSGGAEGADEMAERLAAQWGKEMLVFPADWKRYGRGAGPMRNQKIAESADACLAVLDKPLEESKGTRDCVNRFRKLGKQVFVLELDARPEGGDADFDELSK